MNQPLLLKQYHYTAPATSLLVSDRSEKICWLPQPEQYILHFDFDFEKGTFQLTGSWSSKRKGLRQSMHQQKACKGNAFFIHMQMQTTVPVRLESLTDDDGFFLLDGYITERDFYIGCTGFIVIEKSAYCASALWYFCSFYLYDVNNENFEISCKLPLYPVALRN